jgi:hypothetical protein
MYLVQLRIAQFKVLPLTFRLNPAGVWTTVAQTLTKADGTYNFFNS